MHHSAGAVPVEPPTAPAPSSATDEDDSSDTSDVVADGARHPLG